MKSRLILLTLITLGSAIQTIPTYAQEETKDKKEEKKAERLRLRKKFLAAKDLYEKGKKAGVPAAELALLEQDMKKARRKWIGAIIGIAAIVAATAAAAYAASKKGGAPATAGYPSAPGAPTIPGTTPPVPGEGAREVAAMTIDDAISAGNTKAIDELIVGGAKLEILLSIAIARAKKDMVEYLIRKNPKIVGNIWSGGNTVLHLAIEAGKTPANNEITMLLIKDLPLAGSLEDRTRIMNTINRAKQTPLTLAIQTDNIPITEQLLNQRANVTIPTMFSAITRLNTKVMREGLKEWQPLLNKARQLEERQTGQ